MARLLTNAFRSFLAKQFVDTMLHPHGADYYDNIYYIAAHKSTAFTDDQNPPDPLTDVQSTHYALYDELLFGKHITADDVVPMARNIPWTSGTVYAMYDDRTQDLQTLNYFVVSLEANEYHVFKCLNNNGGVPSTSQPKLSETSPDDLYYRTTDGYEWKYMYSISSNQYFKFATSDYIPIFEDANVVANSVPGSIDTILIEEPGTSYRSYATGNIKVASVGGDPLIYAIESSDMTLSSNDFFYENCSVYIDSGPGDGEIRTIIDYYITGGEKIMLIDSPFETTPDRTSTFIIAPRVFITGDGENARARAIVDTTDGSIEEIIIVDRGQNYTYANIEVVGNTGSTITAVASSAQVRPIIAPPGGHGSDAVTELCSSHVCIAASFERDESNTIPVVNDFRKISLLKNPLFNELKVDINMTFVSSGFTVGETLSQVSTNAVGKITGYNANTVILTNVDGFFETSNTSNSNTAITNGTNSAYIVSLDRNFNTFDQRSIYSVSILDDGPLNTGFLADETVVQAGLVTLDAVNLIKLTLTGSQDAYTFVDGETISQVTPAGTSTGKVVSRYNSILTLSDVNGYFVVGSSVIGGTSGSIKTVTKYDNSISATATGIVHQANSSIIALTDVKGTFLESDINKNTINTFKGQTSQSIAQIIDTSTSKAQVVDGSGQFMYVENFAPVTRDSEQTERIKLIIEF